MTWIFAGSVATVSILAVLAAIRLVQSRPTLPPVQCFLGNHKYPKRPNGMTPGMPFFACMTCERCGHQRDTDEPEDDGGW